MSNVKTSGGGGVDNDSLGRARRAKNDEFYTRAEDIADEVKHYRDKFAGKVVYCNCDDPRVSQFYKFFCKQYKILNLKSVIAATYRNPNPDAWRTNADLLEEQEEIKNPPEEFKVRPAVWIEYKGKRTGRPPVMHDDTDKLHGDGGRRYHGGDFRSGESLELLKRADIVCTNPPFSLFREYIAQLIEYKKKFLVLGNMNAIGYIEIFKLIQANKIWLGINNGAKKFIAPDHAERFNSEVDGVKFSHMGNVVWYTNIDHYKLHQDLTLSEDYVGREERYPKYDNYDAIEVGQVKKIPHDYDGVMGVPITFLEKYNPDQFEMVGCLASAGYNADVAGLPILKSGDARPIVDGKTKFARLLIRRRR